MPGIPRQALEQEKAAEEEFLQQQAEAPNAVVESEGPQPTHPETKPEEKVDSKKEPEAEPEAEPDLQTKIDQLTAKTEKDSQLRSTYEGRHRKEVEDLKKVLEEREAALAQLRKDVEANKVKGSLPDVKSEFSEEEIEDLGPEYIDAMERVTKSLLAKQAVAHKQELEEVKNGFSQSAADTFWSTVSSGLNLSDEQVMRLDQSEEFNTWLGQTDGFSGRTLAESLNEACETHASSRAVRIYEKFIEDKLSGQPQPATKPAVTPAPEAAASPAGTSEPLTYRGLPLDYAKVSELYSKGRISHEEMEGFVKELDKQLENSVG